MDLALGFWVYQSAALIDPAFQLYITILCSHQCYAHHQSLNQLFGATSEEPQSNILPSFSSDTLGIPNPQSVASKLSTSRELCDPTGKVPYSL